LASNITRRGCTLQAQCKHYEAQCDQAAADKQQLQQQLEAALREADEAQSVVAKAQDHANQLKLQLAQAARVSTQGV
jgi:chromosome segregation ATPase